MIEINALIGILGLVLILAAFFLNLIHKLSARSIWYSLINFLGSLFLAYYSWFLGSMPFFILQCVWGVLSLGKLMHLSFLNK